MIKRFLAMIFGIFFSLSLFLGGFYTGFKVYNFENLVGQSISDLMLTSPELKNDKTGRFGLILFTGTKMFSFLSDQDKPARTVAGFVDDNGKILMGNLNQWAWVDEK